jgi:PKD repeat protein
MKKILLIALTCFISKLHAQILPTDTVPAGIEQTETVAGLKLAPMLRPLRGIAGAPAPFYTYLWEFGDGTFSFEKNPLHQYADSGRFDIRLFATNNYDDGQRPPTRPIKTVVKKPRAMLASAPVPGFFKLGGSISLKNNCMPKPGDDMMMIMGYRNNGGALRPNMGGTVAIMYNDKEFSNKNFELAESRVYHGEKPAELPKAGAPMAALKPKGDVYYASSIAGLTPQQLEQLVADANAPVAAQMENFKSSQAWHFEGLKAGEEKFIFLHFKTTPEMLKDTNATVRLSGVFLPDDPMAEKEIFSMELQIVASHDPNKMSIKKTRMNYRLTGKTRELSYKVRFQNNGKGPAKKIDVGVSLSPVFDPATIKVTKTKPELPIREAAYANQSYLQTITGKDSVHFVFNNIYLPGSAQEGVNDADSTQGFVEYNIKFKEKPKKLPIYTGAAIVFDKNPPVYTNRAAGKFKMGLSPAPIIGFGFPIQSNKSGYLTEKNITIGASLAPYSPYKKFVQVEIYLSDFKTTSKTQTVAANKDTVIGKDAYVINSRSRTLSNKVTTINIVPASLRYNLNNYVGVGAGALVSFDINNTNENNTTYELSGRQAQGTITNLTVQAVADKVNNAFSNIKASVFADVVLGMVRVGPSVGVRYFYNPSTQSNTMTTYATWKF